MKSLCYILDTFAYVMQPPERVDKPPRSRDHNGVVAYRQEDLWLKFPQLGPKTVLGQVRESRKRSGPSSGRDLRLVFPVEPG